MCSGCWEEYDSPSEDSPEIRRAVELIELIYREGDGVGTPLHCELDDWNIGDGFWTPWEDGRPYVTDEVWNAAVELGTLMKSLPVSSRASALARKRGYV